MLYGGETLGAHVVQKVQTYFVGETLQVSDPKRVNEKVIE